MTTIALLSGPDLTTLRAILDHAVYYRLTLSVELDPIDGGLKARAGREVWSPAVGTLEVRT